MALREYAASDVNESGATDMAKLHQEALRASCDGQYEVEDLAAWVASIDASFYMRLGAEFQIILYLDSQHSDDSEFLTGFVVVDTKSNTLYSLYVRPERWRQGVGSALMRRVLPSVQTATSPQRAVPFFKRFGLRCTGDDFHIVSDSPRKSIKLMKLEKSGVPEDDPASAPETSAKKRKSFQPD